MLCAINDVDSCARAVRAKASCSDITFIPYQPAHRVAAVVAAHAPVSNILYYTAGISNDNEEYAFRLIEGILNHAMPIQLSVALPGSPRLATMPALLVAVAAFH